MLVAALVLLVVVFGVFWIIYPRHAFRKQMRTREKQPFELIFRTHFLDKGVDYEHAVEFWRKVGNCLGVEPERLRPDDRFSVELAPKKGWSYDDELGAVGHLIKRTAKSLGVDVNLARLSTLSDCVIALYARK